MKGSEQGGTRCPFCIKPEKDRLEEERISCALLLIYFSGTSRGRSGDGIESIESMEHRVEARKREYQ